MAMSFLEEERLVGGLISKSFNEVYDLAVSGDVYAQCALVIKYQTGRDVERDYQKALEWINTAIANGS